MNLKEKFVITINRELGSGGRTVGQKLAEKLEVPFYDKALIKALEDMYKLDVAQIEKWLGVKKVKKDDKKSETVKGRKVKGKKSKGKK